MDLATASIATVLGATNDGESGFNLTQETFRLFAEVCVYIC